MAERLTVLIDATAIPPSVGGVGRYLEGLVPHLGAANVDAVVLTTDAVADAVFDRYPGLTVLRIGAWGRSRASRMVWEQTRLPLLARRLRADVIHSPHYTFPVLSHRARVVTVHDATFFTHPEVHGVVKARFFRLWCRMIARSSVGVIAPSRATADGFVAATGVDASRISVVPHGVDREVFHPPSATESQEFRDQHFPDGGRWIAFLGTLEPRKNVPSLIAGFARAFTGTANPPQLLLAGGAGWDTMIDRSIAEVPDDLRVVKLGYLDRRHLCALLGDAAAVAYPSLGEGFGLPVLEAMSCGAAVITTRHLSLPEVGGDAVIYSGDDPESIASALRSLLADESGDVNRLRSDAMKRASTFTWAACAAGHAAAFWNAAAPEAAPHAASTLASHARLLRQPQRRTRQSRRR